MTRIRSLLTYENTLVVLFSLTWGLVFFDRQALSLLTPLMVDDLRLSNTDVGTITMWQSICFAVSAPASALLADRLGNRKLILVIGVVATAVLSAMTMFAESVAYLIVVRAMLGAAEGVILPIAVALVAVASPARRLGRNVGLIYAGAAVIASTIGPVVVTQLATASGWRSTFLLISVPTLLVGIAVWAVVRDTGSAAVDPAAMSTRAAVRAALTQRNVLVCLAISVFAMAGMWMIFTYVMLYLTQVSLLSLATAGLLMSLLGLFTIAWQVLVPYSSDRIGRRTAMSGYAVLAAVTPALLFLFPRSPLTLVVFVAVGGIFATLTALFNSVIPVESVPAPVMATASALILGVGETVGALAAGGSGVLADAYGLRAVMAVAAVAYLCVAVVALALKETRPRRRRGDQATAGDGTLSPSAPASA